jgi:hypothetical protein
VNRHHQMRPHSPGPVSQGAMQAACGLTPVPRARSQGLRTPLRRLRKTNAHFLRVHSGLRQSCSVSTVEQVQSRRNSETGVAV